MANSILWKDISCEEVGELLLTTEIQECKNRLYDNLSLSNLFSPPAIYNRQGSTDGAASSESMDTAEEKDTMRSPTCSQVEAEKPVQTEEKATIVVRIAEKTAGRTSKVPLIAAVIRSSPFSYLWYMFSAIIIPSSTRIPITIIIPKREITFKVIP